MKLLNLIFLLIILLIVNSCGSTRKAQRKARKVNKLLTEIKVLDSNILDSVETKTKEKIVFKDSLTTEIKLVQDTAKVDSLLNVYAELKKHNESNPSEATTKTIYKIRDRIIEEVLPDTTYIAHDSLVVNIQGENQTIHFKTSVDFVKGIVTITTTPESSLTFIATETNVNIDAVRKRWYQDWSFWLIAAIIATLYLLRSAITTWIKSAF